MKRQLHAILTKGHPLSIKKRILTDYENLGEKLTCSEHIITRSTLRRLLQFKSEILGTSQEEADKMISKKRIRPYAYKIQWKLRHNPGNKRKKHPFQVISRYVNSNYKLVCFRNKQKFNENDIIKPLNLWSIAKKQKCLCALSGLKLTPENVSVDHVIPISKGGKNIISNIRLTTKEINKMRNDMNDIEFFKLCQAVTFNSH